MNIDLAAIARYQRMLETARGPIERDIEQGLRGRQTVMDELAAFVPTRRAVTTGAAPSTDGAGLEPERADQLIATLSDAANHIQQAGRGAAELFGETNDISGYAPVTVAAVRRAMTLLQTPDVTHLAAAHRELTGNPADPPFTMLSVAKRTLELRNLGAIAETLAPGR